MTDPPVDTARGEAVLQPVPDLDVMSDLAEVSSQELLAGTVCTACGTCMVGRREVCSTCISKDLRTVGLGPDGVLYSFTTVHVSPASDEPYTLGYVDLAQGARVLASLEGPAEALRCEQPVRLVIDGDRWAFRPID